MFDKFIKINPVVILSSYKDNSGRRNVIIRVKVGNNIKDEKHYEIPVYFDINKRNNIKLTNTELKSGRYSDRIKERILIIKNKSEDACHSILDRKLKLNTNVIKEYTYKSLEQDHIKKPDGSVNDLELLELLKVDEISIDAYRKLQSLSQETFIDDETGEYIEIDDLINHLEVDVLKEKELEKIGSISFKDRYKQGLYDENNIFDLLGYCSMENPLNSKPLVAESYLSALPRLADYRYNANPSEDIASFDYGWIKDYLIYMRDEGYSKCSTNGFDPLNSHKMSVKFIEYDREPYKYSSYDKQVKHIKRIIEQLQTIEIIPNNWNTKLLKTSNLLPVQNINFYTRHTHHLNPTELRLVFNSKMKDQVLESTRIQFLIQILAGGLRTEELYNLNFSTEELIFEIYQSKTDSYIENPLIAGWTDVLMKKLDNKLPNFLEPDDYNNSLKKLATELGLNRIIKSRVNYANSKKSEQLKQPLNELLSGYFARKTFVTVSKELGLSIDDIRLFTGHKNDKTVNAYLGNISASSKAERINKVYQNAK